MLVSAAIVYLWIHRVHEQGPCQSRLYAWMFYGSEANRTKKGLCAQENAVRAVQHALDHFHRRSLWSPSPFRDDPEMVRIRAILGIRHVDDPIDAETVRLALEDIRNETCWVKPFEDRTCPEEYAFRDGCCLSETQWRRLDADEHAETEAPEDTTLSKLDRGLLMAANIAPMVLGGFLMDKLVDKFKIMQQAKIFKTLKAGGFMDRAVRESVKNDVDRLVREVGQDLVEEGDDVAKYSARVAAKVTELLENLGKGATHSAVKGVKNPFLVKSLYQAGTLRTVVSDALQKTAEVTQEMFVKTTSKRLAATGTKAGTKAVTRTVVKQSARLSARMTATMTKYAMYAAAGPVGAALIVFDVVSMALDVWDPLNFNSFTSIGLAREIRDGIEVNQRMNLQRQNYPTVVHPVDGGGYDDDGPILYGVALMFPTEWTEALATYTNRLVTDLVFEDPELADELDRFLEARFEESGLLDQTFVTYSTSPECPYPLPEWGRSATTEERNELERKRRAIPSELTDDDRARWERRDNGDWVETYEEAVRHGRGCASTEYTPCPCREVHVEANLEALFDLDNANKLEAVAELYNDRVYWLTYRIPPRRRAELLFECLLEHLDDPADRECVCFCPEMLPADDHPTSARFESVERAIGLSRKGYLREYERLVQAPDGSLRDTLVNQVHGDPVYFPIWSDTYRVRDPVEPGTTKLPRARIKTVPTLTVYELVPRGSSPPSDYGGDGPVLSRETYDDTHDRVAYRRARFAQTCALGGELVKCLNGASKDENDMIGMIPGTKKCNLYRVDANNTWEPVPTLPPEYYAAYTKEPRTHTQSRCEGNLRNELLELFPDRPTYTTRWESKDGMRRWANARLGVRPSDYGVTFDFDTGLCRYTKEYCTRYGLQYKGLDDGSYDCKPFPGQGAFEFLLGTTITRAGIMAAMTADRHLSMVQDKLVASCRTGQRAIARGGSAKDMLLASGCVGSFTLQGVRSVLQVAFALAGGVLMPFERMGSQFMKEFMGFVQCAKNPDAACLADKLMFASFRVVWAGVEGAWAGAGYVVDSTVDAIADLLDSIGLDGQAFEDAIDDMREWVSDAIGHVVSAGLSDQTVTVRVPFVKFRLSLGKNTNVCVGAVCADDVGKAIGNAGQKAGKTIAKGFKKLF